MKSILYRSGYKYQLASDCVVQTDIFPPENIVTDYVNLYKDGALLIKKGYSWDGASGPAIDTKNFMRGSLCHDALAQLMRLGLIGIEHLKYINHLLCQICREDGMSWIRTRWVYLGVTIAGDSFARAGTERPVLEAP